MNDNSIAVAKFLVNLGQCQIQIERIQEAIDDHLDVLPDNVNFANVGDAGRLLVDLENIVEYLSGDN